MKRHGLLAGRLFVRDVRRQALSSHRPGLLHMNMFVTAKFITIMFRRAALPVRSGKEIEIRPNGPAALPLRPFRSPCVLATPLPG